MPGDDLAGLGTLEDESARLRAFSGFVPSIGPLCPGCGDMVLDPWPHRDHAGRLAHEWCLIPRAVPDLSAQFETRPAAPAPKVEARPIARYVALGWQLVPIWPIRGGRCACGNPECRSAGKHPLARLVKRGANDARADAATLRAWKAAFPDLNWAVACGPSSLVVVDIDGPDGDAALAALEAKHGALPATCWQVTGGGRGGRQLFFKAPGGRTIKSTAGVLGPKLDIRAAGGLAVVPPSITREPYSWQIAPWDLSLAQLPAVWVDLLDPPEPAREPWSAPAGHDARRGSKYAIRALECELALTATAPAGRRNQQLNRSAHALFRLAASGELFPDVVVEGLTDAARAAGLTAREIATTLASAGKARGVRP